MAHCQPALLPRHAYTQGASRTAVTPCIGTSVPNVTTKASMDNCHTSRSTLAGTSLVHPRTSSPVLRSPCPTRVPATHAVGGAHRAGGHTSALRQAAAGHTRTPPHPAATAGAGRGLNGVAVAATAAPTLAPAPEALEALMQSLELPSSRGAITHLEGNSWVVEVGGVRFLVDPILEGPVDFGMPALVTVAKRQLENLGVAAVADKVDAVLLTQSLDDHLNLNTLRPLAQLRWDIPILAPPSAATQLDPLFSNVVYLKSGESVCMGAVLPHKESARGVSVRATAGAMVGPPWQPPENGYLLSCTASGAEVGAEAEGDGFAVYIEPHGMYNAQELGALQADVVVSHVLKVLLAPGVVILDGQQAAVDLARLLGAKTFVVYRNEDTDAGGIFAKVVQVEGTRQTFQQALEEQVPGVKVIVPEPGQKVTL